MQLGQGQILSGLENWNLTWAIQEQRSCMQKNGSKLHFMTGHIPGFLPDQDKLMATQVLSTSSESSNMGQSTAGGWNSLQLDCHFVWNCASQYTDTLACNIQRRKILYNILVSRRAAEFNFGSEFWPLQGTSVWGMAGFVCKSNWNFWRSAVLWYWLC